MIGAHLTSLAARHGSTTALVYGGRRITYASLNERACRIARGLASLGIRRGERVAVLLRNCSAFIELFFATAKLGAVFVPFNFRLSTREIGELLDASAPRILFAAPEFRQALRELAGRPGFPPRTLEVDDAEVAAGHDEYERWLRRHPADEPEERVGPEALQMLLHSSGTTGLPKGAMYAHATTFASSVAKIIDFQLTPADSTAVFGPLFHAGPLMDLAVPLLLSGGKVVIGASGQFDPRRLLGVIAEERVTVVPAYATMLRRLIAVDDLRSFDLTSLRLLITGGEAVPIPVLHALFARFPGVGIVNNYGSTEGGPITAFLPPQDMERKVGSVGRPAYGVQVRIVDPDGVGLGPGEIGELVVRSPFVCRGYWNRPELTQASLRGGWWHTGDLALRDQEGCLWIVGRLKDMIKSGGENVYPIEVEQVIATLDGVLETAVVGAPDQEWGEAVVAFVVKAPGSPLDAAAVTAHCRRHLASYKKPRRVVFVDALPRTPTNKVTKPALRARLVA